MRAWLVTESLRQRLCLWLVSAVLVFGSAGGAASFVLVRAAASRTQVTRSDVPQVTTPATPANAARIGGINDPDLRALVEIAPSLVGLLLLLLANVVIIGLCLRPLDRLQNFAASVDSASPDATRLEDIPAELRPVVEVIDRLVGQLRALRDSKREFARNSAHVLRTSVAAVCLQVANLSQGAVDQREERLKELEEGARRLAAATAQLLELANARLEPPASMIGEVALRQIVYRAVASALPLAIERGVDLGADSIEDVSVLMVEDDVQKLLFNVIDHAVRQSATASRVDVTVSRTAELGVVEVIQDGSDLGEVQIVRGFEPLPRVDRHQAESFDLELPIAVALAERYGGRIVIRRRVPNFFGSTLRVELPGSHRQALISAF